MTQREGLGERGPANARVAVEPLGDALERSRAALLEHPGVSDAWLLSVLVGEKVVRIAHVCFTSTPEPARARTADAHVAAWRDFFEASERGNAESYSHLDPSGWEDDRTGSPLPLADFAEWVATTIERLSGLGAARVLEIGCGAGNILMRLAPQATRYVGTDVSAATTATLSRHLEQEGLDHVSVLAREAPDLTGIDDRGFDLAIVNSTAQYFPSSEYLRRVMEGCFDRLAPGGHLFIGDVRNLAVYPAWCAFACEEQSSDEALLWAIARLQATEHELLLTPRFFDEWARDRSDVASVATMPRRGRRQNEMVRFRFDAVIRKAPEGSAPEALEAPSLTWAQVGGRLEGLLSHLTTVRPARVMIEHIPNERTALAHAAWARAFGQPLEDHGQPMDPEDLWTLERVTGYEVQLSMSAGYADGGFDALLTSPARSPCRDDGEGLTQAAASAGVPLAREPLCEQDVLSLELETIASLRTHIAERLGPDLVPDAFVVDDPADPGRLRVPRCARPPMLDPIRLPATRTERMLAELWARVLNLELVGVDDDFYDLGGHGLVAKQMLNELVRSTSVSVVLDDFRAAPTISQLASLVDDRNRDTRQVT